MEEKISTKIKNILKEKISTSTNHGLPNIIHSDRTSLKLLWSISTLISTGFCIYYTIQTIINFYKYEVTTKIRVIDELSSEFPQITVCNINFFTNQIAVDELLKSNLTHVIDEPFFQMNLKALAGKTNLSRFGETKEKLIRKIIMDVNMLDLSLVSDFYHPEHGNCFKINSGIDENGHEISIIKMTRPGRIQGMWIILNTSIHNKLNKYSVHNGGIVFINNRTESVLSVDGVMLKPGTVTNIGISRTFSIQKQKPYSNCNENINGYNRKICIDKCYQYALFNRCNCTDASVDSFFDNIACEYKDKCMNKFYEEFYVNLKNECLHQCPVECELMYFTKTISSYAMGNLEWEENYREIYGLEGSIRNSLVGINIYYERLGYTEITESESINLVSLIAGVGGVGGLFLGISFLSCIEFIDIIFEIFITLYEKKK